MRSTNQSRSLIAILGIAGALHAESMAWKTMKVGGAGFVFGLVASRTEPNLVYARTDKRQIAGPVPSPPFWMDAGRPPI